VNESKYIHRSTSQPNKTVFYAFYSHGIGIVISVNRNNRILDI